MLAHRLEPVVLALLLGLAAPSFMPAPAAARGEYCDAQFPHDAAAMVERRNIDVAAALDGLSGLHGSDQQAGLEGARETRSNASSQIGG